MIFDYEPGWDTRGGPQPNLASDMDSAEHERIARNALQLLAGNMPVAQNAAEEKLEQLKEAYEDNDPDDVLWITKGIHQIPGNPHIQLKLERAGGREYGGIHLNVSASEDAPGLPEKYFHWVGVQFTADANNQTVRAVWPLGTPARDMKDQHSRRRMSIAPKDIQSRINAIAIAQKARQQAAQKVAQDRLAQQTRDLLRKNIADQLAKPQNSWTISGNKSKELDRLIAGETIDVKTKTQKTIKVKFEGGIVKQSFTS